ncbi:hypothetical protein B0H19DRAFT_1235593 [Mycena capillaripes]|nr:hypothetical protein B0H19DRAFT_1235593 [Mycena capillaripes]
MVVVQVELDCSEEIGARQTRPNLEQREEEREMRERKAVESESRWWWCKKQWKASRGGGRRARVELQPEDWGAANTPESRAEGGRERDEGAESSGKRVAVVGEEPEWNCSQKIGARQTRPNLEQREEEREMRELKAVESELRWWEKSLSGIAARRLGRGKRARISRAVVVVEEKLESECRDEIGAR